MTSLGSRRPSTRRYKQSNDQVIDRWRRRSGSTNRTTTHRSRRNFVRWRLRCAKTWLDFERQRIFIGIGLRKWKFIATISTSQSVQISVWEWPLWRSLMLVTSSRQMSTAHHMVLNCKWFFDSQRGVQVRNVLRMSSSLTQLMEIRRMCEKYKRKSLG